MTLYDVIKQHNENNKHSLLKAAEAGLNSPLPPLSEQKFALFEQTGDRLTYEADYFARRRALLLYGVASLLREEREYLQHLEDVIRCICEEETWALPAHVNRATNRDWRQTVDLFAAETAQALAEIITLLKDRLSEETQNIARENIIFRVLVPFCSKKAPYSWWEKGANNWNAVCCGCIGSAALYLDHKAQSCVQRVTESLKYYIASFPEDGACLEGLAYFSYGMSYFVAFARQLKDATGGTIDLFKDDKLSCIAAYQSHAYFSGGGCVPFSDGDPHERFRLGLACFLSEQYKEAFIPPVESAAFWDTDFNYRWASAWRDIAWTEEWLQRHSNVSAEPRPSAYQQYVYRTSQQVLIHHNAPRIAIGIKGGNNGEPHNHNDVGSFFLMKDGEIFLEDLGFGEYTKDYFAPATRYQHLVNRSCGHNVPMLDDCEQSAGKDCACTRFQAQRGHVIMEIGNAYAPNAHLKREICYSRSKRELTICDTSAQTITENIVTRIKPEVTTQGILLKGQKSTLLISFTPSCPAPQIISGSYRDHWGQTQTVYRIIQASGTRSIIAIRTN